MSLLSVGFETAMNPTLTSTSLQLSISSCPICTTLFQDLTINRFSGSPSSVGSRGSTHVNDLSPSHSRRYQNVLLDNSHGTLLRKGSVETQVATPPKDRSCIGFVNLSSASSSPTMDMFYDAASTVSTSSVDHVPDRFSSMDRISFGQNQSTKHSLKLEDQLDIDHSQPNTEVTEQDSVQSLSDFNLGLKASRGIIQTDSKLSPIASGSIWPITPIKTRRHRLHNIRSNTFSPDSQPHYVLKSTFSPPDLHVPTTDPLVATSLSFDLGLYEPIAGYLSYAPCIHPPLCISEQSPSFDTCDNIVSPGAAIRSNLSTNQVRSEFFSSQSIVYNSTSAPARQSTHRTLKGRFRRTPDRRDCPSRSVPMVNSRDEHEDNHFANLSLGLLSDSSYSTTRRTSFSTPCHSSPRRPCVARREEKKRSGKKHRSGPSRTFRDRLKKRARKMKPPKPQIR